jgi:lipopolysaccharide export system protein LptA
MGFFAGRIALAMFLGLLCLGASAKKTDRQQPMDVHADHLDGNLADDGVSVLTGNVVMTQGTLEIRSDKAVITRKDGEMSRAVLTGGPVHLKQLDENNEPMYATSRQTDYDLLDNVAVLTGDAIVNQPSRGQMHGEKIVYDVDNGKVTSGNDGTRVLLHILPKAKAGQAAPKAEAPPPDLPDGKTP